MTAKQAKSLEETLESMLNCISKNQDVMAYLEKIEKWHRDYRSTAPPMLDHYLQRRSYTKALDFLKDGVVIEAED